jgi:hypothetical protein
MPRNRPAGGDLRVEHRPTAAPRRSGAVPTIPAATRVVP